MSLNIFKVKDYIKKAGKNKSEFDVEINKDELEVLKKGIDSVMSNMIHIIAAESKPENIKGMIDKYNNANSMVDIIIEEEENEYGEITIDLPKIDIIVEALKKVEDATTKNLKTIEDTSNYKILCKTMVLTNNLMERIISLI